MKSAHLILLASGTGKRFDQGGDIPKQLIPIKRKPLVWYAMTTALELVPSSRIILTCPPGRKQEYALLAKRYGWNVLLVEGGSRRQDSVQNAFRALEHKKGVVLIHDSARPLASRELYSRVYTKALRHGAAVPVIQSPDTVKEITRDQVVRTINRDILGLAQTPQGFRIDLLRQAFSRSDPAQEYTDEAGLLESLGLRVFTVKGERWNLKLTFEEDLAIIKALINENANRTRD